MSNQPQNSDKIYHHKNKVIRSFAFPIMRCMESNNKYMLQFRRILILFTLLVSALCTMSLSHINLKTTIKISENGEKIVMYDANQKGEIIVVVQEKGFQLYKLVSLDYYRLIGEFEEEGILRASVGDVIEFGNQFGSEKVVFLMTSSENSVNLYKILVQKQKIQHINTFQTQPILNILSNKHKIPYLTIQTTTQLQFYHIDQLTKEHAYTYRKQITNKLDKSILTSNRARNQVLLIVEGRVVRAQFDRLSNKMIVSENHEQSKKRNIVGVSFSNSGKEMYVATSGLLRSIYRKWTSSIAQYMPNKGINQNTEDNILMEVGKNIKGISIDKLGIYLAYLEDNSLNLGRLSKNQIQPLKSYDLSKHCQPFAFTHIQYIYQERLVIPCTQATTTKLLIIHTCQAQGCTDFCGPPCGDCWLDTTTEECDDCNMADGDGCSSLCIIEHPPLSTEFKIIYIEKYDTQNRIQIKFQTLTNATVDWATAILDSAITIVAPPGVIGTCTFVNENNGVFLAIFTYTADIQGQALNVTIDFAKLGVVRALPYSQEFILTPYDNQVAYLYDDSVYQTAGIVKIIAGLAFGLGMIFFFLGIAAGKIIGIEMMAVIQISYLSLLSLNSLNPSLNLISQLFFVNGYNNIYNNKEYLIQSQLSKVKGITLFPRFLENYNFTMALVFVPLLISLIVFIISKIVSKDLSKYWKRLAGEYSFNGLMFGGYIVGVSLGLQFLYGLSDKSNFIGVASIFFSILFILMYVLYFVLLIVKPEIFGEFTNFFNKNCIDPKFYLLLVPERLLVGACLVFLISNKLSFIVVICVYAALGIIVIIRRPYLKLQHNTRYVTNMLIAVAIQIIYMCYNLQTIENQNKSDLYNKVLPIIIAVLLLICVLYSGAAIIWQIVTLVRGQKQKDQIDKQNEKQEASVKDKDKEREKTKQKSVKSSKSKSKKANNDIIKEIEETKRQMLIQGNLVHEEQAERRPIPVQYVEGQKYQLANKIKKQLRENFGLNPNNSESQSNRERIIHDNNGPKNYQEM